MTLLFRQLARHDAPTSMRQTVLLLNGRAVNLNVLFHIGAETGLKSDRLQLAHVTRDMDHVTHEHMLIVLTVRFVPQTVLGEPNDPAHDPQRGCSIQTNKIGTVWGAILAILICFLLPLLKAALSTVDTCWITGCCQRTLCHIDTWNWHLMESRQFVLTCAGA